MDGLTPVPTDQVELIRKNAAMVREALTDAEDADAGFGAEGAAQLDRYIESVRATAGNPAMLGQMFGCHLGESLISAFGGEWVFTPEGLGVRLAPNARNRWSLDTRNRSGPFSRQPTRCCARALRTEAPTSRKFRVSPCSHWLCNQ